MDIVKDLRRIGNEIQQLRGQQHKLEELRDKASTELERLNSMAIYIEEGQVILQNVALATQQQLKLSVEPIVTSALDIVYKDKAYGFEVDFEVKRDKTEASLYFTRNGKQFHPLSSSGFGAVDVAAFALRLALWNISKPQSRPVFLLDEPFKHVSEDLQESVMEMVSTLSKKLGLQILLITHNKEIDVMEYSDKVFRVGLGSDFVSKVKVVKE